MSNRIFALHYYLQACGGFNMNLLLNDKQKMNPSNSQAAVVICQVSLFFLWIRTEVSKQDADKEKCCTKNQTY